MGRLLLEAVANRDFPLMQALFLFTTVGVLIANFLADMVYGLLDPRVRQDGGSMTIHGSITGSRRPPAAATPRASASPSTRPAGPAGCPAGSSSCGATASAGSAW